MATLNLPGLSTGIDTNALVQQLMEINRMRLNRYKKQVEDEEEKQDAVVELGSKLSSLRSAAEALSDNSKLKSFEATTSDSDVMTAEASPDATESNHSIEIKQLATAERWIHDGFKYSTTYVGAGNFVFSYNYEEMVVQTTAETTLEDLVGKINNSSDNPGVNASILKYDDGNGGVYHLILGGRESGGDFQITVNDSNTEVHIADSLLQDGAENAELTTKLKDLDGFTGVMGSGSTADRIRITGNQHDGTAVDVYFNVTSFTIIEDLIGEINEAFEDIHGERTATATFSNGEIKLTDNTFGASSMTLTLTFDPGTGSSAALTLPTFSQTTAGGSISANIASLDPSTTFVETQSAQDSLVRFDNFPGFVSEVQEIDHTLAAGGGEYYLTYRGETTATLYPADTTATIQAALEALSTVNSGDITVSGTPLDTSGTLTFTFRDTLGDVERITLDDSALAADYTVMEITKGQGWISRSSNTIDDIITGVTLKLHDTTFKTDGITHNAIEVNLTRDTEALKEKVQALLDAYNTVALYIDEETSYDEKDKEWGKLRGEYFVTTILNQIKTPFILAAGGFGSDDEFINPSDIGIDIGADGMLSLDNEDFDEAIVDKYLDVLSLIGAVKTGYSTGIDAAYIKFSDANKSTTAGSYDVRVTLSGGAITLAEIKQDDGSWRTVDPANIDGNTIYATDPGDVDSNGNPLYDEHNLAFTMDVDQANGTYNAKIYIRQGFAGAVDEALDEMLARYLEGLGGGRVSIAKAIIKNHIDTLNKRITIEQDRLENVEQRLIIKFARLESTLTMLEQQMGGLGL